MPPDFTAGVVGATGYAGAEVVGILADHPRINPTYLTSRSFIGDRIDEVYPRFTGRIENRCEKLDLERLSELDVVFLAVPHGTSMDIIPFLHDKDVLVVDLAADYRFNSAGSFEEVYGMDHRDASHVEEAVYGLAEYNRERVAGAELVANPGCYATAALMGLYPLLNAGLIEEPVYIDAKSGITGAGRSPKPATTFVNCNEDIKPYKVGNHRHQPEIVEHLPAEVSSLKFVPHVIPADRGIEAALYFTHSGDRKEVETCLKDEADNHELIRYRNQPAGIKAVAGSPYCDLAVQSDAAGTVVFSCLDNLQKGAASQAVQNANLMLDLDINTGLV